MVRIKLPHSMFVNTLIDLMGRPGATALCETSMNSLPGLGLKQLMFHRLVGFPRNLDLSGFRDGFYPLFIRSFRNAAELRRSGFFEQLSQYNTGLGLILISDRESMHGYYHINDRHFNGPYCLSLPGPGMEELGLIPIRELYENNGRQNEQRSRNTAGPGSRSADGRMGKYDRFAGWVGKGNIDTGRHLMEKARRLRVIVIGAGRSGSWLVFRLAQEGVGAEGGLVIADMDVFEESNMIDVHVPYQALGKPKAEAVAMTVAAMVPDAKVIPINASLNDSEVIDALRSCDIAFTAVDDDAPRFGVAIQSVRHHITHIDISGGSAWIRKGETVTGGELRCFIPGCNGCLACMGSYRFGHVRRMLNLKDYAMKKYRSNEDWFERRPGSNADVLLTVIGEAMQTFWGIIRGDISSSFWFHYEHRESGLPLWTDYTDRRRYGNCKLCGKQSGLGGMIL